MATKNQPPSTFQDESLPAATRLAGSAALVHRLGIPAPVRHRSCVSSQYVNGSQREEGALDGLRQALLARRDLLTI